MGQPVQPHHHVRLTGRLRNSNAQSLVAGHMSGVAVLRMAVFSDDPAGGNPAGVVLDGAALDDAQMLRVAADVGYSETAFVTERGAGGRFKLRFFSPLAEVPFCGHATLGTAAALAAREPAADQAYEFETAVGTIAVRT